MLWPEHVIRGFALFDTSYSIASGGGEEFADDVGKVGRTQFVFDQSIWQLLSSRKVQTAICASEKLGSDNVRNTQAV